MEHVAVAARLARGRFAVPLIATASVLVRLPTLRAPLSSDEGGFLLVASQWHPGTSLYGDYWVDRPPLLLAVYALAHLLGGTVALRLVGCVAAAAVVVLAAAIGRRVAGPRAAPWVALAAAGLVSTPMADAWEVSGELLAVPWVLAGLLLLLHAREAGRRRGLLLAAAGAAGATAFLVKQSFLDVFVLMGAWTVLDVLGSRRDGLRASMRTVPPFVGGAAAVTTATLAVAAWRGTWPSALWDAVVVFRSQATHVIATSASPATEARFDRIPAALLATGALFVVLVFVARLLALRTDPLAWATAAMLGWEVFAVVAGGSYWLHYLLGLVPGLCLGLAVALSPDGRRSPVRARPSRGRWLAPGVGRAVATFAAVSAGVALVVQGSAPAYTSTTQAAGEWLEHHHRPGDTAVVAYGQPNLLDEAGVASPYPEIWSLPVRVRDPGLRGLVSVLRGPSAPDWVLVDGQLQTWGVRAGTAQRVVAERYHRVADVCGWVVYLRDGEHRPHAVRDGCAALAARG
jgi:hypothetical protein